MLDEIKRIESGRRQLRQFGITMAAAFIILAVLSYLKAGRTYYNLAALAVISLFLGLFLPPLLKPLQKIWMDFAIVMGWFMSRLILILIFYAVVTPTGVILKLMGKDTLRHKPSDSPDTYWVSRSDNEPSLRSYENQY